MQRIIDRAELVGRANLLPRKDLLEDTIVLLLAGGRGTRLYPLTRDRTKGAVPFGGMYRLIDFTLANCVRSGLRQLRVLPQYRFASLERRLRLSWSFLRPELGESLEIMPPQQRINEDWYKGTGDAVFQNLYSLRQSRCSNTLILSSDHVYRMDYRPMLERHRSRAAALTIACCHVPLDEARGLGVAAVDRGGRIMGFEEKPDVPRESPVKSGHALVSMGNYVFDTDVLTAVLSRDSCDDGSCHDFGKDIIPRLIADGLHVQAYDVADEAGGGDFFWRDIGTIDGYWAASMDLLGPNPLYDLSDPQCAPQTYGSSLPPACIVGQNGSTCDIVDSLVCSGSTVRNAHIRRSILSPGVRVNPGAVVEESVLMEGVEVGAGAHIYRTIVDKNVRIPEGFQIGLNSDVDVDRSQVYQSPKGVTVVAKDTELMPDSEPVDENYSSYEGGQHEPTGADRAEEWVFATVPVVQ